MSSVLKTKIFIYEIYMFFYIVENQFNKFY